MANLEQISQFCRLCLVKDDVNTPIFDDQEDIRQIYLKISSCLPVKISKEDNLPKKICGICTDKLDTVYAFWKITVQSEKQLIEWLKQIGVETGKPSGSLDHTNKVEPLILKQEIVDPIEIRTDGDGAADTSVSSDSEKANVDTAINKQKSQTSSEACGNIDEPPTKRARRAAAFKRPILEPDSEEEDDPIEAKVEDYSDDSDGEDNQDDNDPDFVLDNDDHSNADDQPGPSGVGKSEEPPYEESSKKSHLQAQIKCEVKLESPKNTQNDNLKHCLQCSKTFINMRKLRKHMISHSVVRPFSCDICKKAFKRKYEVKVHQRVHTNPLSFHCNLCPKVLKSKGSFMIHRRRHLKQYVGKCEICDMGFVTNQEYQNHMGSKHGGSSHICEVCGRSCYDKASLQGHMARHAKDYEKNQFKCDICNKNFLQQRYLKHHMMRVHTNGGLKYICDLCGKEVNSKRSLRDHLLLHQGIKPLECKECGKNFAIRSTLKLHMRTHTGDRPHECPYCERAFTQRGPLKIHMRYHTGERPYVCEICSSSFVSKSMLTMHMKKHSAIP